MNDDWNIKDELYYPGYKHENELHVTEVHLGTLRQKLLEDLTGVGGRLYQYITDEDRLLATRTIK